MSWTTPADLRSQVRKLWDRGAILSSMADGEALFPRRLALRKPSSADLVEKFDKVRAWISDLIQLEHCRVVVREVRHQIIGTNTIPDQVWVDTLDDALALIGRTLDADHFRKLLALTEERRPELLPWLSRRPLKSLELAYNWPLLLDITDWMQSHPRPGIYLRQIELGGIHTKFIEAHRSVLTELLDLALPPEAVESRATGISGFCRRYGFLDKPRRIRFRILDRKIFLLPGSGEQDITLNQSAFNSLDLKAERVFITENEINFLAFPDLPATIVIFGSGYGFEMLAQASWLRGCAVHYWGDIDTHGFAILDQLRSRLPRAASFLMDRETLMTHKSLWVSEPKPLRRKLARLRSDEQALFNDLRYDRLGTSVRLEQERISFGWVKKALNWLVET